MTRRPRARSMRVRTAELQRELARRVGPQLELVIATPAIASSGTSTESPAPRAVKCSECGRWNYHVVSCSLAKKEDTAMG